MQIIDALSGAKTTLEEIFPGDVFGEVGMVLGAASPIVVTADEDCETLVIQKNHFDKIAAAIPESAPRAVAKRMGTRFVKVSMLGGSGKKGTSSKSVSPDPVPATMNVNVGLMPTMPGMATGASVLPKGAIPSSRSRTAPVGPAVLELIPTRVILEHRVLPLELRGRTLVVGMVSPYSLQAKDELRRARSGQYDDPEIVANFSRRLR